jgi:hypothetical protein
MWTCSVSFSLILLLAIKSAASVFERIRFGPWNERLVGEDDAA